MLPPLLYFPTIFVTPKRNFMPISRHSNLPTNWQPLATTNLLSVSVDLLALGESYKREHAVVALRVWLLSLNVTLSRFIQAVASVSTSLVLWWSNMPSGGDASFAHPSTGGCMLGFPRFDDYAYCVWGLIVFHGMNSLLWAVLLLSSYGGGSYSLGRRFLRT